MILPHFYFTSCYHVLFHRRFEKRIYIGLPEAPARADMFRLHLGDTKSTLTDMDFKRLGQLTDNYSGADIQIVVRDALMQPIRRVQHATHFMQVRKKRKNEPIHLQLSLESKKSKKESSIFNPSFSFQVQAPDRENPSVMRTDYWMPCSPGAPGAVEKNWMDVDPECLWEEPVSMKDMEASIAKSKPSVNDDDLARMQKFTDDFGQEGN